VFAPTANKSASLPTSVLIAESSTVWINELVAEVNVSGVTLVTNKLVPPLWK